MGGRIPTITLMITGQPMRIEALLTLSQWLSPSFPVGSYAYSHGLEAAVRAGWVDPDSFQDWLEVVLRHGAGWNDALFLAAAWRGAPEADETARAFAAGAERLRETVEQGAAFGRAVAAGWGHEVEGLTFPVAVGRAAALEALPVVPCAALYLQAFAANLAAAGQRLMPLGQTRAQAVVRDLAPLCHEIAEGAAEGDLDDLSSTAFLADIAAMRHETLSPRIFRT